MRPRILTRPHQATAKTITYFIAILCALDAHASILVLRGSGSMVATYGGLQWKNFSAALDSASDNKVTAVSSLENRAELFSSKGLLIEWRAKEPFTPPFDDHKRLTTLETQNLADFIAAGHRVVMLGEWDPWRTWNQEILGIVGGTYVGTVNSAVTSAVAPHAVVRGASSLTLQYSGLANGGTPLYSHNFATLWGDKLNVLTILDSVYSDDNWPLNNGGTFATNVANWLAVPEPSCIALVCGAMLSVAWTACRHTRYPKRTP